MRKKIFLPNKAFTVLEIIMVITVIGIISVLAMNRLSGVAESKINLTADKIVSDIKYAQNLAMSLHEEVVLDFDAANNKYEVKHSDGTLFKDPFTGEDFVVDFNSASPFKGVSLDSVNFNSKNELHFDTLGRPQDKDGHNLSSQGEIDISYKGYTKKVIVYPNTGFCQKS